ncbi:hypothetical protein [Arthrobacter sp. SLBN-53]|uniref:hypothetical protein n=1 Tax=Arthrobacter sp. SLBN-53 TaxID=2768412 RepID=UPI001154D630|nr:hypothetical protein [Arthrobacter sp. SLBN-53]
MKVTFLGSKRLVLQCDVISKEVIADELRDASLSFEDLHLTVFHIGKSRELYAEVAAISGVSLDAYEARMVTYLRQCTQRSRLTYQGEIISADLLESDGHTFSVLRIAPEATLLELRDWCRHSFLHLLKRNGIPDPEHFMQSSSVVQQHSPAWLPHVTLAAKSTDRTLGAALVRRQLVFGPLHVRRSG